MNVFDYSQLPALKTILTEKNISRAAARLGISQPAMSRIFSKLKDDFKDPLMVRSGNEYQLTHRAQILLQKINLLIPELEELYRPEPVAIEDIDQTFHIAGTDMDITFISDKINRLTSEATKLQFMIYTSNLKSLDDLLAGEFDFVLTVLEDERSGLYRKKILEDTYVVLASDQCRVKKNELDLETYLSFKHGRFVFPEDTRTRADEALAEMGHTRTNAISIPTFMQITSFINDPNLLFTVPKSLGEYLCKTLPAKLLPLPFEIRPLTIYLYWHERQHHNKVHKWVRDGFFRD